ncbi:MAG TPA: hypothetical protein VFB66_25585 [Tepidisphaeraceae bacterium]|nr:hypothetical protein [Tepidisphaeraceae bacterium]
MIVHRLLVAILMGVAASLPAAAQDGTSDRPRQRPPTGQVPKDTTEKRPPSAPAEPADTSTPKGSLKVLAAALRAGDAAGIRRVMHATNPSEVRMVAAMADMAGAMAQLQRSAVRSFGAEGAKQLVGDTHATDAEGLARIEAAEVRVASDTATVTLAEGKEAPVTLKRIEGEWKIPVAELARGANQAALDEQLSELAIQTKLVRELAGEVEAGKFATPSQAHEAWQSRAMQASTRRPTPPVRTKEGAGEKIGEKKIDK